MSGFASGFESGYGLVSRDMAQRRRDALDRERLEQDRLRDKEQGEYRAGILGVQKEQADLARDREERATREGMIKTALDAADLRVNAERNALELELAKEARERQATVDAAVQSERDLRMEQLRLQNQATELQMKQNAIMQDHQRVVSAWAGQGSIEGLADSLVRLEGTGMHPATFLGPDAKRLSGLITAYTRGDRKDFRSPDFLEVANAALLSDTALMKGMVSGRPGFGEIKDMEVIGVDPAQSGEGVYVRVRVQAENGDYTAFLTRKRDTSPNAEPAVVSIKHLTDRAAGWMTSYAAVNMDPESESQVLRWAAESNPAKAEAARRSARETFNAAMDRHEATPAGVNGEPYTGPSYEDLYKAEIRNLFGFGAPSAGGASQPTAGQPAVVQFSDLVD